MSRALVFFSAMWISLGGAVMGQGHRAADPRIDGRDTLLAALGTATLECLGTVGPLTYRTNAGVLERTFAGCRAGSRSALIQIDAILALQVSEQGRADDIAGHYVSRWNAFLESFPDGQNVECPLWQLESVIDAPTRESIPRIRAQRRIGKENYRYRVSSRECQSDGGCATRLAVQCAAGFGPVFIVDRDPGRSRVEVDPMWWLTTYDFVDDQSNPFQMPGYYHAMSYYGELPGSLYGAVQREGEACSQWDELSGKHYTNRVLTLIDCGGGWRCMTYCMMRPATDVSPPAAY
jgi:hypothetical protein